MAIPAAVWILLALVVARLALRPVLALVFGKRIGAAVLAKQPATIHLQPASESAALVPAAIEADAQALMQEGFADVGWFTVPELPEVTLRLLAHEPEGWLGTVYEHRRAGRWVEINARFPDGSRTSFNNLRATGLSQLPGVKTTRVAGRSAANVLEAARASRASGDLTPLAVGASTAVRVFEEGYAALTALRREQGISRAEVAAVSVRRPLGRGKRAA